MRFPQTPGSEQYQMAQHPSPCSPPQMPQQDSGLSLSGPGVVVMQLNVPNGPQDLVASSQGQHPDSTPNLQACTQSEAQVSHSTGQPKVASHFSVPACSCVTGDTSGKWHFKSLDS